MWSSASPWGCCCWACFTYWTHSWCHAGYVPEHAERAPDRAVRRVRAGGAAFCASLTVLLPALPHAPAAAADTVAPYGTPSTRCDITDPRLPELSGLATAGDSMLAMNAGGDQVRVYVLDGSCAVTDVLTAALDPYDPEDTALGADGTVWLADT